MRALAIWVAITIAIGVDSMKKRKSESPPPTSPNKKLIAPAADAFTHLDIGNTSAANVPKEDFHEFVFTHKDGKEFWKKMNQIVELFHRDISSTGAINISQLKHALLDPLEKGEDDNSSLRNAFVQIKKELLNRNDESLAKFASPDEMMKLHELQLAHALFDLIEPLIQAFGINDEHYCSSSNKTSLCNLRNQKIAKELMRKNMENIAALEKAISKLVSQDHTSHVVSSHAHHQHTPEHVNLKFRISLTGPTKSTMMLLKTIHNNLPYKMVISDIDETDQRIRKMVTLKPGETDSVNIEFAVQIDIISPETQQFRLTDDGKWTVRITNCIWNQTQCQEMVWYDQENLFELLAGADYTIEFNQEEDKLWLEFYHFRFWPFDNKFEFKMTALK